MIGWLWRVIVGTFHQHKWETVERRDYSVQTWGGQWVVNGQRVFLKCTECGEWQSRDV